MFAQKTQDLLGLSKYFIKTQICCPVCKVEVLQKWQMHTQSGYTKKSKQ